MDYRQRVKHPEDPVIWAGTPLQNRLILAPMAGFTNLAYRRVVSGRGVALTVTELCSARGILHDPTFKKNYRYLALGQPPVIPTQIQLFGSEPEDFEAAIPRVLEHPEFSACASIDINMGCPVKKVCQQGSGAALMTRPEAAAKIVEVSKRMAEPYGKKVTCKIRSGWDDQSINAPEFASMMERAGASGITVHGRTRQQFYQGRADWEVIGETAQKLTIPLAANGDIQTREDAIRCLNEYGASALMIGRAAVGNPWIFESILTGKDISPDFQDWSQTILTQLVCDSQLLGETAAVREFRPTLSAYLKGRPNAATLRREMMELTTIQQLQSFILALDS